MDLTKLRCIGLKKEECPREREKEKTMKEDGERKRNRVCTGEVDKVCSHAERRRLHTMKDRRTRTKKKRER